MNEAKMETASNKPVLFGGELSSTHIPPLVTNAINGQRFVLIASRYFITCLSYGTGERLGVFVLQSLTQQSNSDDNAVVECTALAQVHPKQPTSQMLYVGCSNGSLFEFDIASLCLPQPLDASSTQRYEICRDKYCITGPVFYARRMIRVANQGIQPILSLSFPSNTKNGDLVLGYALVQTSAANLSLMRLQIIVSLSGDRTGIEVEEQTEAQVLAILECHENTKPTFNLSKPIQLASCAVESGILLLVGRRRDVQLFHDDLISENAWNYTYTLRGHDQLTTLATNGTDLACGHASGRIHILSDFIPLYAKFLTQSRRYQAQKGPNSETNLPVSKPHVPEVLCRKLHWHAFSVATLSFETNSVAKQPFLYSGGVESVLVGWHLARGMDKPSLTLPRVSLGGISHICHVDGGSMEHAGLLAFCTNGALLLFHVHNLKMKWKVASIPFSSPPRKNVPPLQIRVVPSPDASSSGIGNLGDRSIAFFGSPEIAGFIHWMDPEQSFVRKSLEVAPFNRVSRTEVEDSEIPPPLISHAVFSKSGKELLTVNTSFTELSTFGAITSLKFWSTFEGDGSLNTQTQDSSDMYKIVAEISSPHGLNNRISGAALSASGSLACTVSNDESSFRVWKKFLNLPDSGLDEFPLGQWYCKYKITIPSGFAKFDSLAVAFSGDESTLAINHGSSTVLWSILEEVFLCSLPHCSDDVMVERIRFLPSEMLLTCSKRFVVVQSPFGNRSAMGSGWRFSPSGSSTGVNKSFSTEAAAATDIEQTSNQSDTENETRNETNAEVSSKKESIVDETFDAIELKTKKDSTAAAEESIDDSNHEDSIEENIGIDGHEKEKGCKEARVVSCAEYIDTNESIAVALFDPAKNSGTLIMIDVLSGKVNPKKDHIKLPGKVIQIACLSGRKSTSSWDEPNSDLVLEPSLDLAFVIEGGQTFRWRETDVGSSSSKEKPGIREVVHSPPFSTNHEWGNKRKRHPETLSLLKLGSQSKHQKPELSIDHFGTVENSLSRGAYTKAFIRRHLN